VLFGKSKQGIEIKDEFDIFSNDFRKEVEGLKKDMEDCEYKTMVSVDEILSL